jgi:hypothetical protein
MRPQTLFKALLSATALIGCDAQPDSTAPRSGLTTRWAGAVTSEGVHPEYPRPQMVRSEWQSLNGEWDYAIRDRDDSLPAEFDGKILVPFPVESQLSGVARSVTPDQRLWYRRSFEIEDVPDDHRWLLHFGAVDWHASVHVNGALVGEHRGGYDPFSLDITDALHSGTEQELVVGVWDPTDQGDQPRGKQVLEPRGIWYTAVTGIWQTVWLEPVPASHITSLRIVPNVDAGTVSLHVNTATPGVDIGVRATALEDDREVARGTGSTAEPVTLRISDAHLWSPDSPFLYGLAIRLETGDSVLSYFGMRKISVAQAPDGHQRIFLNDEPLFHFGPLDQGWWPDGLYTAPSDSALHFDVEATKRMGFNMARKHVKVEPDRWYYHADRLGLMVWQDMPSGDNESAEAQQQYANELQHVVDALYNHPSIVMWVPFNEGWGQHDTEHYVEWLEQYDPSRLVNNASGWADRNVGAVLDIHRYPGPGIPPLEGQRAVVLGEFGGLGLPLDGHTWVNRDNWGYRSYGTREELGQAYADLLYQLRPLIGEGLAAAVYTQTTDVEIEVNGLLTYDRAVEKLPPEVTALNAQVYGPLPRLRTVLPTAHTDSRTWRYTTEEPSGDWRAADYDDSAWSQGAGGFGTERTPSARVGTVWDSEQIWLRQTFQLENLQFDNLHLRIHHDEDAEVYFNGEHIGSFPGYSVDYTLIPLSDEAIGRLRLGANTIAVHVLQTDGGQYIDAGLVEIVGL